MPIKSIAIPSHQQQNPLPLPIHIFTNPKTFNPTPPHLTMHFTTQTLTTLALTSTLASAAPSLSSRSVSKAFTLTYNATTSGAIAPPEVNALNNGDWVVDIDTSGHAILKPKVSSTGINTGTVFYEYGADGATRVAHGNTSLQIKTGGSATVPSTNFLDFVENGGTEGLSVVRTEGAVAKLQYGAVRFQACRFDGGIVLRAVAEGQRFYAECAPAVLVAVCSGEDGGELGGQREVECEVN
jgi:hypothetical protein